MTMAGLCAGAKERDDDVVPDYETIFVKQDPDHVSPISSTEIDKILTDRMQQNLYTSSSNEDRPPNPPPKQKHLDSNAIDTREIIISPSDSIIETTDNMMRAKPEPVLFEPPSKGTPDKENMGGPQKFKKGNLRLTQTKDGDWKLEELEDDSPPVENGAIPSVKDKKKEGKKSRRSKDDESPKSELLRKPSIKKIRAFFNRDSKESSETSPQNDSDVASAISKLPKVELDAKMPMPTSKSVPNSLDRRSMEKELQEEQLSTSFTACNVKPALPVKRSKSMKSGLTPTVIAEQQVSSENVYNPLPKPKRTLDYVEDDTRKVMKDCQDYLMASFDMAEREGERLMETSASKLRNNRSAENRPDDNNAETAPIISQLAQ